MGKARGTKVVSHAARKTRQAMVARLKELIAREYPDIAPNTAYKAIETATGISLSSMQRIMSEETGPSIDTLSDLAKHLGSTVPEIVGTVPFPQDNQEAEKATPAKSSRILTY